MHRLEATGIEHYPVYVGMSDEEAVIARQALRDYAANERSRGRFVAHQSGPSAAALHRHRAPIADALADRISVPDEQPLARQPDDR